MEEEEKGSEPFKRATIKHLDTRYRPPRIIKQLADKTKPVQEKYKVTIEGI